MDASRFVGTWRLISDENQGADGQVSYPFGQDSLGLLIYSADGYMSVVITTANRTPFADGDLFGGSLEERAAAAASCVSYCGRYEVRGELMIHHVEASLFPNWTGGTQERLYQFSGNRLTLSTKPILMAGREERAVLVWERVSAAP